MSYQDVKAQELTTIKRDLWRELKRKSSIQSREARVLVDLDYALIWTDIRLFLSRFQIHQPFLRILSLSNTRIGVLPEVKEFLVMLYGFALIAFLVVLPKIPKVIFLALSSSENVGCRVMVPK